MSMLGIPVTAAAFAVTGVFLYTAALKLPSLPITLDGRVAIFAAKYPTQDCLVVSKSRHLLYYCRNGFVVRSARWDGFDMFFPCPIAIGSGKRNETPTGEYFISVKNEYSRYTLFLGISYPSIADANTAYELGYRLTPYDYRRIVVANLLRTEPPVDTPLGGTYGIHGAPTYMKAAIDRMERSDPNLIYVTRTDNTRGCIAVEHRVLRYLFANVDVGTPILILN